MPLRVLYSFPHTLGGPGIGTTALQQVSGLVRHGAEVTVWCTSVGASTAGATAIYETLSVGGRRIPHRALGTTDRAMRYHDWRVARAIVAGPHFEVVHSWPLGSLRTLAAARRKGILGVREVPNTHTEHAYERSSQEAAALGVAMPSGQSHRFNAARLDREHAEYEAAQILLVPSAFVEETFIERGFSPAKLARHQYGFDPARFPARDRVARRAGLVAAFVGHCEPRKGLHYALEAWIASGAAERGRFVICGEFIPDYRRYLERYLKHRSVDVRGFVADTGAVMRDADVLLLPAVEEGSALVTYEAQASGCVLLVSKAAGAHVSPDGALIHEVGDIDTLTGHLRAVDSDSAMLDRLRAATLAWRDELTWDRAAERLIAIYTKRGAVPGL